MEQKQQIADRIKQANNILVTVSSNPSVDQLASCIGLTISLNKLGKHATAVFSGEVPSTIEFLQPEKTLEKDTNSLRDFIIALDKAKADKLRYKVEDKVVKIFITPYRTSIGEKDLDFSQGDFNVDVVIALGVHNQAELDHAITSHGRILHDATVATVNVKPGGDLGSINWLETTASSLCELAMSLVDMVDDKLLDSQIATAFLTGIVAETARFSNEKTTPATMSISAELMAAGANQQLVATKLEEPTPIPKEKTPEPIAEKDHSADHKPIEPAEKPKPDDGTLEIAHLEKPEAEPAAEAPKEEKPEEPPKESVPEPPKDLLAQESSLKLSEPEDDKPPEAPLKQIKIDDQGALLDLEEAEDKHEGGATTDPIQHMGGSRMILQPPTMGGQMNAGGMPDEGLGVSSDPLSLPNPSDPFGAPSGSASFAPSASAATAATPVPFMPASMTPGATSLPASEPPRAPVPPTEPPKPAPFGPQDPAVIAPFGPPTPVSVPQPSAPVPAAPVQPPFSPPPAAAPAPVAPVPPFAPAPPPVDPLPPTPSPELDTFHADVDSARNAVLDAIASQPAATRPEPIQALNAQPLGDPLHDPTPAAQPPVPDLATPAAQPSAGFTTGPQQGSQLPPPPGPPPMMPPSLQ